MSDLEHSLVDGGMTPAAAKIVSNAIANLASQQLSLGRQFSDATQADLLRMVTPETRKHVLTNLDQHGAQPFSRQPARGRGDYAPVDRRHPYQGSQPATAAGTLATPKTQHGDFIDVRQTPTDSVAQDTVSLRVNQIGGTHARLNQSTKSVDAVPFFVEVAQEQFIEASFEERPNGTVLKIALKNLQLYTLPDSSQFWGFPA